MVHLHQILIKQLYKDNQLIYFAEKRNLFLSTLCEEYISIIINLANKKHYKNKKMSKNCVFCKNLILNIHNFANYPLSEV